MAAESVIVTRRMQPVSKTELLTEVVYGVTTELHPNSDFTENMHIFTKYTSLVFAHIILYIIHVHTTDNLEHLELTNHIEAFTTT